MLDEIIRRTIASTEPDQLRPQELRALLEVAQRHHRQPLEVEPVVVDLVESMLKLRPQLAAGDAARREMARQIATTLFESPESQQRLRAFWRKLVETMQ